MKRPRAARRGANDGREGLFDERTRVVRPERLIAGGAMIALAIVWIVIQNLLGTNGKQAGGAQQTTPVATIPALATPQAFEGGQVNAALVGKERQIPGRPSRAGYQYWVFAVRVTNEGTHPVGLTSASFSLRAPTGVLGPGQAIEGHAAVFSRAGIGVGKQAEGDLAWQVAISITPDALQFTAPTGRRSIVWFVG
ncbi:MAG TPA: hypothetical protein VNL71_17150 [Chloroflexota bacterium]|nr:hypothetical protein [Chloroflexota bacterium]